MKKLFSIIIPTYNYSSYLANAVQSILSQPDDDYEIVIVDDGSTDDTATVIATLLQKFPGKIASVYQDNQGPAAARNKGALLAQGSYFLFLDADDELLPNALQKFRHFITASPDVQVIIGGYETQMPNGTIKIKMPAAISACPFQNFSNFIRQNLFIRNGSTLIAHNLYQQVQFPIHLPTMEDIVFFGHILALGKCATLPEMITRVHKHADSLRHNHAKIMATGNLPVTALFDHPLMPPALQIFRNEFAAYCYLTLFRANYLLKNIRHARYFYHQAIRSYPKTLLRFSYLRKYLKLIFD